MNEYLNGFESSFSFKDIPIRSIICSKSRSSSFSEKHQWAFEGKREGEFSQTIKE